MFTKKFQGFTLIELLTVMAVIAVLAGLILSISGYAQKKAATSKADTQIQGISTALENYKADNGTYPRGPSVASATPTIPINATDLLDAKQHGDPTTSLYTNANLYLYVELSGDKNANGKMDNGESKGYFEFKPDMLSGTKDTSGNITAVKYLVDPFGYSYGYSTAYQADLATNPATTPTHGYNPTFDLWCTVGKKTTPTPGVAGDVTLQWIKNW